MAAMATAAMATAAMASLPSEARWRIGTGAGGGGGLQTGTGVSGSLALCAATAMCTAVAKVNTGRRTTAPPARRPPSSPTPSPERRRPYPLSLWFWRTPWVWRESGPGESGTHRVGCRHGDCVCLISLNLTKVSSNLKLSLGAQLCPSKLTRTHVQKPT